VLERERCDRLTILAPAANSGECYERANICAAANELRRFGGGVKWLALQAYSRSHFVNLARQRR